MCLFFHCLGRFFLAGVFLFFFWPEYIVHFEILFMATSDVGIPWDWFVLLDELPSQDENYKSHL